MNNVYNDIAQRTNGDIYIGVVGPVRTGKSTFVSKFIEQLVIPNIEDKNVRARATDELPQSADGRMVMTTQPNFVPNVGVTINFGEKSTANVRLIDCVGYLVEGAEGGTEGDKVRLVSTPWSDSPMPFDKAAELGTRKVVQEHSTIAVVVTNDGTVTDIPRENYVSAEEQVINELKQINKPFVIVLNTRTPKNEQTVALAESLQNKYGVQVIIMDVANATKQDFEKVLESILSEFSVRCITVDMPRWMRALDSKNEVIASILDKLKSVAGNLNKMKDVAEYDVLFDSDENISSAMLSKVDVSTGTVCYTITPQQGLFYNVLSKEAGTNLDDEYSLMSYVTNSAYAKRKFDKFRYAIEQAESDRYGVVKPDFDSMDEVKPQVVKQGNKYVVKLTATAPTYHIMRVDVTTEVSPLMGTEQQCKYLVDEFDKDPKSMWNTSVFGKTMHEMVEEGLAEKSDMPVEARGKLVKAVGKMVNENRGGLICFLL